jgi:hypothetical protein
MKSKTVASIMRHVASKLPSVDTGVPSEGPTDVRDEGSVEPQNAKKEVQDEDISEDVGVGGSNEELRLEKLYEQVAWPLGKKYGHPYDAFKLTLTYVQFPRLSSRSPSCTLNQRTGDIVCVTACTCPSFYAGDAYEHNRPTFDSTTDQVACRHRAHLLYSSRYRRNQKGSASWREGK